MHSCSLPATAKGCALPMATSTTELLTALGRIRPDGKPFTMRVLKDQTGFLGRWVMPLLVFKGLWMTLSVIYLKCWLALRWSGSWDSMIFEESPFQ